MNPHSTIDKLKKNTTLLKTPMSKMKMLVQFFNITWHRLHNHALCSRAYLLWVFLPSNYNFFFFNQFASTITVLQYCIRVDTRDIILI